MSPTENPEGLLAATRALLRKVEDLDAHLKVHETQARRTRYLTIMASALAVISLIGVVVMTAVYRQVQDAVDQNQRNAVTACENSNESRKANLSLWQFVLSASAANNPNPTPREKRLRADFRDWVAQLFAPRDCSDLSQKVEIPPPPQLG